MSHSYHTPDVSSLTNDRGVDVGPREGRRQRRRVVDPQRPDALQIEEALTLMITYRGSVDIGRNGSGMSRGRCGKVIRSKLRSLFTT